MNILVLHNRSAGDEEPSPGRLLALLRRAGYAPKYFDLGQALEHPARLPEAEFTVVAGGDGSVRQAMLKLGAVRGPFALLPLGTANNIARSLGIEGSVADVIARWDRSERRRFDVGRVRGPFGEKRFVEGVGVGLFGRLIEILMKVEEAEAHENSPRPHRVASELRSTTVLAHEMAPLRLGAAVDGENISGEFLVLEALNIARVGSGIELAGAADISDGMFDIATATAGERNRLLLTLAHVAKEEPSPSRLSVRRARRLQLVLPVCSLRVDDEVVPIPADTPVEIEMTDEPVEVLVPGE